MLRSIHALLAVCLLGSGCAATDIDPWTEGSTADVAVAQSGEGITARADTIPDWVEICIYGFALTDEIVEVSCATPETGEARSVSRDASKFGVTVRTADGLLASARFETDSTAANEVAIGVEPMQPLWLRSLRSFGLDLEASGIQDTGGAGKSEGEPELDS